MEQWTHEMECCSRETEITGFADVLKNCCRWGVISLKRRLIVQTVVTQAVLEAIPILLATKKGSRVRSRDTVPTVFGIRLLIVASLYLARTDKTA